MESNRPDPGHLDRSLHGDSALGRDGRKGTGCCDDKKLSRKPQRLLAIPIFLAVIASVDILKDKKNRFRDILTVSGTSQWNYYCSKIAAYLSVGFALSFVFSYSFFFIRFFQYDMLRDIDYSLAECLWLLFVRWIAYSIPVLTVYVSLSVCTSLACRSAAIGIVLSVAYAFAKYMIP